MPPRRAARGCPARRNVVEQKLPNAPDVQPQGEVTNVVFHEAIRNLSKVVTNKVAQQRGARQEWANSLRIFLRMNPPSFTSSNTTEDPKKFVKELKKVFDVMHVVGGERVELDAYQRRVWLEPSLINERMVELRMHNIQAGFDLKKPSWGVSFPEN